MASGNIESSRSGSWATQAISRLNPGQGVSMIISGPVESDLHAGNVTSSVDFTQPQSEDLYLVGMGFRKDTGYRDTLLNCQEIWVPFENELGEIKKVTFRVDSLTSFTDWIYVWMNDKDPDLNKIDRSWIPSSFEGVDVYDEYQNRLAELDYDIVVDGPGGIIFVPYIHPNYLTTDDYNGILGNVMRTEESQFLYTVFRRDIVESNLVKFVSPNLRYKNYLEDYHKFDAVGGLHAGELIIPGGELTRCVEESEYFKSFDNRVAELSGEGQAGSIQTLDFPYMSYRAISASVYVDRFEGETFTGEATPKPKPLSEVWEDLQGGNTDDPETIYFVNNSLKGNTGEGAYPYIKDEIRTTVPVEGKSILFRMDGHLAVRVAKATVYAPFLNTVYRTGQYGLVLESFTSQSAG